ncbi:MAG: 23S rRNA (adenine(2503)-C(2))-methyltransferase RlmN [Luteolibacter sp.]|jgi:23S rRNA (adenine2503-C2)-methyltransferase
MSFAEMESALAGDGVRPHHAKALWRAVHHEARVDLVDYDPLLPPVRRWLVEHVGDGKRLGIDLPQQVEEIRSSDGLTRKFLLRLTDGQVIETVLMAYDGRFTACLSTQAGCAMGCVFCATGQMGFVRHLRPGEIVAQVLHVRRALAASHPGRSLRNLVLMGMGEPMHNYDAVIKAMHSVSDRRGLNIGPSRIAISTVGVIPAILRMAEEQQPFRLAVSLHGSTEEERRALVPVSAKWPLDALVDACREYGRRTGRRIFFGWTLIAGKNDSPETARRVAKLLDGIDAHINLIPLNPTDGFAGVASPAGREFQRILLDAGFPCTFRQRRGIDVAAGCGMLKAENQRRTKTAG